MRVIVIAAVTAVALGHTVKSQHTGVNEGFLAINHHTESNSIPADMHNGFKSLFKVTALVRSLTSPVVYQTTTAPKAGLEEEKRHDEGVQSQNADGAGSYNFMTAAIRPFLAAFNASGVAQRRTCKDGDEDAKLPVIDQFEDVQIQILSRTPVLNQQLEPQRLSIALSLSFMMAMYGWKIGSYSGLKCCMFLLFLVYFRLRSMHDTRS